ncbi:hypothetical protein [Demequina sp.]|uniref:hypothetical protein n=1 Tax=Demequina sp. TaxID=2050685 RepID=UPI003A86A190
MTRARWALAAFAAGLVALLFAPTVTGANWADEAWFSARATAGRWDGGGTGGGGGIEPGNDGTIIVDVEWDISGPTQECGVVHVQTNSSVEVDWRLHVDTTVAPWNGVAASEVQVNSGGVKDNVGADEFEIVGNSNPGAPFDPVSNNTPIVAGQEALVTICEYSAPGPAPVPDEFYGVTITEPTRDGTQVCSTMTVQGKVDELEYPFYYGWERDVDVQAMIDVLVDAGLTYTHVSFEPDPGSGYNYTVTALGGTMYHVESNVGMALQGDDSATVTVCAHGYLAAPTPGSTPEVTPEASPAPAPTPATTPSPQSSATPRASATP